MDRLYELLAEIKPDVDFKNNKRLIDDNIFDSMDLLCIVSQLEDTYNIKIPLDAINNTNFNSIEAIKQLVDNIGNDA